jgi:hypothetical protein
MSTNNIPSKNAALALNQKVSAGVNKYFSKVKSITVGGTTYTPRTLLAVLSAENDAAEAVDSTRVQLSQQVATHRAAKASAGALRSELRTYILGTYGAKAVQMLGDFGMSAPKYTGNKSAATKAQAVVQGKATREARHTMGKNQKKPIKGVVPSTATQAAAPSSSAPAATPAQVAQATEPAQTVQASQPAPNTATH